MSSYMFHFLHEKLMSFFFVLGCSELFLSSFLQNKFLSNTSRSNSCLSKAHEFKIRVPFSGI
jgi:hypothetical protein